MSERGSFVTEYIYCADCLAAAASVLLRDDKYLRGALVPAWTGCSEATLPIIAGKVGDTYPGGEIHTFEHHLVPALYERICHPMRIAVLAETGEQLFLVKPKHPAKGVRHLVAPI
jgi:hypothetical protein